MRQINRFRAALDDRHGTAEQPAIPLVDGRIWSFNTRQFRRTLAWYIANRPFGVVAGKIQYKHASVAMFDGYAGSSASGFRRKLSRNARSANSTMSSRNTRLTGAANGWPVPRLPPCHRV